MKKILLTLAALTIMASAQFETFKSQTQRIGSPIKTEEVFFGKYTDFSAKLSKGAKDGLSNALIGGIVGGISMGGVYGVIGLLDPFVMDLHADQKYLKVVKLTDSKGKVAFKKVLFVGDKNPSYSDAKIRQLMK